MNHPNIPKSWWLLLFCTACGDSTKSLDGSIAQSLDLEYDDISIRLIGQDLEIQYLRDVEGSVDEITAKLVVEDLGDKTLAGLHISLDADNASVGRSVRDGSTFPEIAGGTLSIDEGGDEGDRLTGEFGVEFITGATLNGDFSATLEIPDPC